MDKKGQGLSLNTIIIAALALIVLVVIVMIFTGRIGIFSTGVQGAGDSELATLKISYGTCHPSSVQESTFKDKMSKADSETLKEEARGILRNELDRCKAFNSDENVCKSNGCLWK